MRAVIYARCSTEEESQKDALVKQVMEAKECIKQMGWTLVDSYIESRSGTTTKGRTEYNRLYDDLQETLFDVIVIKSQDRLMRNTKDWYLFVDRLCTNRKKLYIYIENKFYTADDALITGIKAILAEEYSRELSKKINNAHQNRQKNGGSIILTSNAYGFRKLPDQSVELIESEAYIKRRMYQLCADGYGSRTIANILRNEGIRKRSGKVFSENDILRILRNPLNMGTAVMHRQHFDFETKQIQKIPKEQQFWHEGKVPATVSQTLWVDANRQIDLRASKVVTHNVYPTRRRQGKYDLSGKLICGFCGAPYYRRFRKTKREKLTIVEWKCKTYLLEGRKSCQNISFEEEKLFILLEKVCMEQVQIDREKLIKDTIFLLRQVLEQPAEGKEELLEMQEKRIRKQQDLLVDRFLEGVISEEIYKRKQKRLETDLQIYKEKKQKLEIGTIQMKTREKRIAEIVKNIQEGGMIERASVREMLKKIDQILVYPSYMELVSAKKLMVPYGTMFNRVEQKQEERREIIDLLKENPKITARDLAAILGCSLSGANYKLKVLRKEGKIQFIGKGGHGCWKVME